MRNINWDKPRKPIYVAVDARLRVIGVYETKPVNAAIEIVGRRLLAVGQELLRESGRVLARFRCGSVLWVAEQHVSDYDSPSLAS